MLNLDIQKSFPQGPYFEENIVSLNIDELSKIGRKEGTVQVLKQVNTAFTEVFNSTLTESMLKYGKQNLQRKLSKQESKKKTRQIYKQFRDKENEALQPSTAVAVLTECESVRSYKRKRKQLYFESTPPAKRRTKSHSPNFSNVTWDKDKVLHDLQQFPPAPPSINWSAFAKEHGVAGSNAGQVVKQFAITSGINTSKLDGRQNLSTRSRVSKQRLLGGEISVPTTPTDKMLKEEWRKMVQSGKISLGQPCIPYKMVKFNTKEGSVERLELNITGRKFPLMELRQQLLAKHEQYMRLNTDSEFDGMSQEELQLLCLHYHHSVCTTITRSTKIKAQTTCELYSNTTNVLGP